jgi:hypothetical protein
MIFTKGEGRILVTSWADERGQCNAEEKRHSLLRAEDASLKAGQCYLNLHIRCQRAVRSYRKIANCELLLVQIIVDNTRRPVSGLWNSTQESKHESLSYLQSLP